jgi:membrane protease YdiL (CAAX protease family)
MDRAERTGDDEETSPAPAAEAPAPAAARGPGLGRRVLGEELLIVLGLTFLASAIYALVDIVSAPSLAGTSVTLYRSASDVTSLVYELLGVAFALVPVALVLHLLHRCGETAATIGLTLRPRDQLRRDVRRGLALAALVGAVGLGIYLGAVALGLNRNVAVISGETTWWTGPVWVLNSFRFGMTEEVIVAGYLLHRLDQLGWSRDRALAASAVLRGSYHLYQGLGGFVGNLAMGLLFGRIYQRSGRTLPLVIAHVLVDAAAGLGYLALRDRVGWIPGP